MEKYNRFGTFYNKYRETAIRIPVDSIVLTEKIHTDNKDAEPHKRIVEDDKLIMVGKPLKDGTYQLVIGWGAYMEAKERGLETILCIETEYERKEFYQKYVYPERKKGKNSNKNAKKKNKIELKPESLKGSKRYLLDNIKIPSRFRNTLPRREKIDLRIEYYKKAKRLPQAIRIDAMGRLYDGYATYIAAKEMGLKEVPVFIKNKLPE